MKAHPQNRNNLPSPTAEATLGPFESTVFFIGWIRKLETTTKHFAFPLNEKEHTNF